MHREDWAENLPGLNIKARHSDSPRDKAEVAKLNSIIRSFADPSEMMGRHVTGASARQSVERRGNLLADHFFIFKAAPSKVVTMACISPSLVM
jgi:hypothetical protein